MTLGTDGLVDRPVVITVSATDDPIPVLMIWVTGETHPRYVLYSDGDTRRGSGSAAPGAAAGLTVLTDNSGGTPSNTIADVPGSYTEATLANQIASLAGKINEIIAVL